MTDLLLTDLACAFVSLIRAGNAESPERLEFTLFSSDLSGGLCREGVGEGNRSTCSSTLEVFSLFRSSVESIHSAYRR